MINKKQKIKNNNIIIRFFISPGFKLIIREFPGMTLLIEKVQRKEKIRSKLGLFQLTYQNYYPSFEIYWVNLIYFLLLHDIKYKY